MVDYIEKTKGSQYITHCVPPIEISTPDHYSSMSQQCTPVWGGVTITQNTDLARNTDRSSVRPGYTAHAIATNQPIGTLSVVQAYMTGLTVTTTTGIWNRVRQLYQVIE
jgi:hypothetical protein